MTITFLPQQPPLTFADDCDMYESLVTDLRVLRTTYADAKVIIDGSYGAGDALKHLDAAVDEVMCEYSQFGRRYEDEQADLDDFYPGYVLDRIDLFNERLALQDKAAGHAKAAKYKASYLKLCVDNARREGTSVEVYRARNDAEMARLLAEHEAAE